MFFHTLHTHVCNTTHMGTCTHTHTHMKTYTVSNRFAHTQIMHNHKPLYTCIVCIHTLTHM